MSSLFSSSARLHRKNTDEAMEQPTAFQTRSFRSFRRYFFAAFITFIFLFVFHQNHLRDSLQQSVEISYRSFRSKDISGPVTHPRHIDNTQTSFREPEPPSEDEEQTQPDETALELPEVLRIPFEEAVRDVSLEGWEDEWMSSAIFNPAKFGPLREPKIDFVYNWVNGSEAEFNEIKHQYELLSPLNDPHGRWISKHSVNRYRDWDELKYSFRSLDKNAKGFINKIQLLVNSVPDKQSSSSVSLRPQRPSWLKKDDVTRHQVQILAQEDFFAGGAKKCAPSFDSVSIESQIHNTPSNVDQLVALSDDMFLGTPHHAADFYSPLFGTMMAFKPDSYNVKEIKKSEIPTFGEKPYLYYTSWLLNHRFGDRARKTQAHFSHSISRRVMKEALSSFPRPAMHGSCERFRGESKFQIYPWYTAFHYSIERFREALLWSFVTTRADANGDGYLDWTERQSVLSAVRHGKTSVGEGDASSPAASTEGRDRLFYQLPAVHKKAGLQPPVSNINVLWTSLDGPETIRNVKCHNFQIAKCFSESFDSPLSDTSYTNPDFNAANIFKQLAFREPKCGDCFIKYMLAGTKRGLEPLMPPKTKPQEREMVVKALIKYQHSVVEPEAKFFMIKDAEQAKVELLDRVINRNQSVTQWCFNDDVMTEDETAVSKVNGVIQAAFNTLFPSKSRWEID